MSIQMTNFGGLPMEIRNVDVRELPRVLSIDSMVPGAGAFRDPFGTRFRSLGGAQKVRVRRQRPIRGPKQSIQLPVAEMADGPHILQAGEDDACDAADAPNGLPDAARCGAGFDVSLFPSTTLLLTADAITPNAKVWNPRRKRFVRRDLKSKIWFQVGGRTPDFNKNGVDDAVDIEFGDEPDANEDGVPDSAQQR
jgi:hypothetical protein